MKWSLIKIHISFHVRCTGRRDLRRCGGLANVVQDAVNGIYLSDEGGGEL